MIDVLFVRALEFYIIQAQSKEPGESNSILGHEGHKGR